MERIHNLCTIVSVQADSPDELAVDADVEPVVCRGNRASESAQEKWLAPSREGHAIMAS